MMQWMEGDWRSFATNRTNGHESFDDFRRSLRVHSSPFVAIGDIRGQFASEIPSECFAGLPLPIE